MKALIIASTCCIFLMACSNGELENAQRLAAEKHSLACEMECLKLQTDSLWDGMENYLDENLPDEMPAAERLNMVTIRNANLIAMFKAFPKLDSVIQQKVREAGTTDQAIADSMKSVMEKMEKVEQAMNETLLQIQERSDRKYQQLKEELHELEIKPCHL